jgi:hypothetical protein
VEAEHNMGASKAVIDSIAHMLDKLMEDRNARIVGQSQCRLAQRMGQWAATTDDDWQGGKETNFKITTDNSTSANERLLQPLLDGSQGKKIFPSTLWGLPCNGAEQEREQQGWDDRDFRQTGGS